MTLILLILSLVHIKIEAIYIPSSVVRIDVQSLLKQTDNFTSDYSYVNVKGLASKNGYAIEEHRVTTEDGYILGLHHLTRNTTKIGVPVLLMHGLLDSSDSWILQGPETALGYLMDRDFDVWMGNARGNKYSSKHKELNPSQEAFWNFSWEEIGIYDLPAMIDYILNITNKRDLYYVGHSQGTTSFFAMTSLKPEYISKIKMMFALSPIAWLSHATSPLLKYLSSIPLLQYFQFFNTITSNDLLTQIYGNMCKVVSTGCGNIFEMVFGNNYFVNNAMLPIIIQHSTTSSVLQFVHYWQLYQSGRFCRFDYGWMKNLLQYGQFSPPDYELSGITVPIVMFFSGNDWMSHPYDVALLHSKLSNVYISYYSEYFSHIDYMYASVAKEAIYDKIVKHIQDSEGR